MNKKTLIKELLKRESKTSITKELSTEVYLYTKNWPESSSFQERKYSLLNHLTKPPKCKYSDDFCVFNCTENKYELVSKNYYIIMKHDKQLTDTTWLTWQILFDAGLPLELAKERFHGKYYQHIRLRLPLTEFSKDNLLDALLLDEFNPTYAKVLVDELDINNYKSIDIFMEKYNIATKTKNTDINHYIYRGFTYEDARLLQHRFFKRASEITKNKRKNDVEYDRKYCESRKNGVKNLNYQSKIEIEIINYLKTNNYNVASDFITTVDNYSEFKQITNRNFFKHDIYLKEDNVIIEYNGIHWHKDEEFEIQKAYYCSTINNCKYILVWEDSFTTFNEISEFIEMSLKSVKQFNSSKYMDELNFEKLRKLVLSQQKWDKKFLEISESLSEMSKCQSKKVCALAVKNNRIIATGLNGSLTGLENCCEKFDSGICETNREEHHEWSKKHEIHAEENLLMEAAKNSHINLRGCTIYCNLQPCEKCSLLLSISGATRIVYSKDYDKGNKDYSHWLFKNANILFSKIN